MTNTQALAPPKPYYEEPGRIIEIGHPFIREEYSDCDGRATISWRPGVRTVGMRESVRLEADGVGAQILTIVARFKPEGWPERVFYTRQWRDPDGKVFGKRRLHVRTAGQFTALTRGYRHTVDLAEPEPVQATLLGQPEAAHE